jgi:hypothetical protein
MGRAWIALVLLGCAACSYFQGDADKLLDREITGEVLLESYSVDMTWGYKLSGMYINADGTVWAYEQSGTPWYPDKLKAGELSQHDMLTKHKDAHQIGTVDRKLLHDVAQMIKPASRGKITRVGGSHAGDGSLEVAYLLDPDSLTYHEIILAGSGNRVATNSAPEVRTLLDYLREVERLVEWPGARSS